MNLDNSKIIIFDLILAVIIILFFLFRNRLRRSVFSDKYAYKKKDFLMSRAEHEFFDILVRVVGNNYHIFPQVHLSALLEHKIQRQYWWGAFRHINGKSVDFVLCDKKFIKPILVIELDDKTHEREDRIKRDEEVERVLNNAGLPIVRFDNHGIFNEQEISQKLSEFLIKR